MNCREVHEKIADYSADALPESEAQNIQSHFEKCPPCQEEYQLFHDTMLSLSTASQPLLRPEKSQEMWRCCARHIAEKTERERLSNTNRASRSWFRAPWLGWASLATSCAVLGAVWFSNAQNVAQLQGAPVQVALENPAQNGASEWVSFQSPPSVAAPYINHHTLMAFDPFSDRVGSTLVADIALKAPTDSNSDAAR